MWPMWQHIGMCTNKYISYDICVLYPDDVYIQDLNHEWYATLNTWHLVHMITVDVYPQLPLSHVSEVLLEKGEFEECALTSEFITPGIISRQKFVSLLYKYWPTLFSWLMDRYFWVSVKYCGHSSVPGVFGFLQQNPTNISIVKLIAHIHKWQCRTTCI